MPHFPTNFVASPRRQLLRLMFIILGLILVTFGFFQSFDRGSEKILWVIDNSLSMAVSDIQTASGIMVSRLDFAKQIVVLGSRSRTSEQAIMSAAYGARLELPMTDDLSIISDVAQGIAVLSRGGGSTIGTAFETIRLIYGTIPHLHIIWITDGEFSDSGVTLSGFTTSPDITFIGVGSRSGGPILEGYDIEGRPRYKESGGTRVNSIRDDTRLVSISDHLGARLIFLDSGTLPDLSHIAKNINSNGIFSYLITMGVFFIVIGLMISRFRYNTPILLGK